MKKLMLISISIFFFYGFVLGQQKSKKETEKKVIIIKTIDDKNGEETVIKEIFISGDFDKNNAKTILRIEDNDSLQVKINIEEEIDGNTKIFYKIGDSIILNTDFSNLKEKLNSLKYYFQSFDFDTEDMKHAFRFFSEDGFFEKQAFLGVNIEDFNNGVKITEIIPNSAAFSVGMEKGDVITSINGVKTTNAEELIKEIKKHKAGDFVEVSFLRNGKKKTKEVRLHGKKSFSNFEKHTIKEHKDCKHKK